MVESTKKAITRYCFIVRHGERADNSVYYRAQIKNWTDPMLTPTGHAQASETGKFLRTQLEQLAVQEDRPFSSILLKTSPFIRVMATAARISKELSIAQVDIDYTFCEFLSTTMFGSNPIPNLE